MRSSDLALSPGGERQHLSDGHLRARGHRDQSLGHHPRCLDEPVHGIGSGMLDLPCRPSSFRDGHVEPERSDDPGAVQPVALSVRLAPAGIHGAGRLVVRHRLVQAEVAPRENERRVVEGSDVLAQGLEHRP